MNKLSLRDILRHLEHLVTAVPGIDGLFENDNETASFVNKLRRLLDLIQETGTAEPGLKTLREALFPGAKEDSRRVLFSNFRKTLALAASHTGKNLALVQPNLRGKELDEVLCWFEGDGFPAEPEIAAATQRSIAGLDRSKLIPAPAAMMTSATNSKITEILRERDDRGRQRIRIFISYSHKNEAPAKRCLNRLREELAISKQYDFHVWQDTRILVGNEWHQDIQQALRECDICLALCSPAFFGSDYIIREELPLMVNGTLPGVPVMLESVDFRRHDLHGAENLLFFSLNENGRERAYSECSGEVAKRFVRQLAEKIEERVPFAIEEVTRRIMTAALSEPEKWGAFVTDHPELEEILTKSPRKPRSNSISKSKGSKERFDRLLRNQLPEKPELLIDAVCAGGGLREISRQIQRRHEPLEHEDPYERFRSNQHNAVDYLMDWVRDPDGAPFAAVLGEIGSGKTTTLKMLTAALRAEKNSPPVIFIDLRDYFTSGEPKLEDLLAEHLRRYGSDSSLSVEELLRAVREQNALIIFDGLDEKIISLGEAARQNFIRELWRILPAEIIERPTSKGRGKLIISCRSHYFPSVQTQNSGYLAHDRSAITANDYLACIMLPWQDKQIREYLSGCLGEDKVEMALELIETIHNLKDLSSRPYLLNLIGPELEALEKERASGRPINAAALYHQFIERWFARDEGKHVFTPVHKRRLMEQLAADLWRDHAREWPWERVEEWLDEFLYSHPAMADGYRGYTRAVLKQDFRTATMFLRPDGAAETFRFAHTSLQEYFLACHLARRLYTGESLDPKAWDLPSPSQETFEFTGQLLQLLSKGDREVAMTRLKELLGNADATVATRTAALEYFVIALKQRFPVPNRPDLEMQGVDITAWEIDARTLGPVSLGSVNFSGATLIRTRIEGVAFPDGSIFCGADLQGSKWIDCELVRADFSGSALKGSWFRSCNLTDSVNIKDNDESLLHLCKINGQAQPEKGTSIPTPSIQSQLAHSDWVSSIKFSPNEKIIASSSADCTIKIWSADNGFCLRTLSGHTGIVTNIEFSPNGKLLASTSEDKTIRIWNPLTGHCKKVLQNHSDGVWVSSFSSDNQFIACGSDDGSIAIWDVLSGNCIKTFNLSYEGISSLIYISKRSLVLYGTFTGSLVLFNLKTNSCIRRYHGHTGAVWSLSMSASKDLFASASSDGSLKIWNFENGHCIQSRIADTQVVWTTQFIPDGNSVVTGSEDGTLKEWSLNDLSPTKTIYTYLDGVRSISISKDGTSVLAAGDLGSPELWNLSREVLMRTYGFPESFWIDFVSFSPNSASLYVITFFGSRWEFTLEGKLLSKDNDFVQHLTSEIFFDYSVELIGHSTIRLRQNNRLLRDIIPLPDGITLVIEPWDEGEALKPPHECRWKLVRGPADAWRYAVAVDPETLEVHPPEYATENGTWEII